MPTNERKRQEKLVRKATQRKKRVQSVKSSAGPSFSALSPAKQMPQAVEAPVYECLMPAELFEIGIGDAVFSRKLPDGDIAVSVFLLDVYCLGVKNAFFKILSEHEYRSLLRSISQHATLRSIDPACLRKLVEEAEAYAADLGFSPHPDYLVSRLIFGAVDRSACSMGFEFGKDGKPLYVSGPHDTEAKSRRIIDILTKRCGPGGFHYLVALDGPPGQGF
jgi:hypothetical protein